MHQIAFKDLTIFYFIFIFISNCWYIILWENSVVNIVAVLEIQKFIVVAKAIIDNWSVKLSFCTMEFAQVAV